MASSSKGKGVFPVENLFFQEFAAGFFTGFVVMYAFRKFVKFFFLFLGLYILSLLFLDYAGLINVNVQGVDNSLVSLAFKFQSFLLFLINEKLTFSTSAVVGALLALKIK